MIDRDAAVLQHEREIAVADREHQIPARRQRITSAANCRPLNT
jgi:hypothetical protein